MRRPPPGRAGALWLRRRLAVTTRGTDLLHHKLTALTREAQRLHLLVAATGEDWRTAAAEADEWLARAALLTGQRGLRMASAAPAAEVDVDWATVMGVRYPVDAHCRVAPWPAADALAASQALTAAFDAHRRALPAAARHAAATAALRAVTAEVAATRQRVRALERHWTPMLRDALDQLELAMEELEHADALRRRRALAPPTAAREET